MNKVAQLSSAEHRDLFQETANRRGVSAAVIEKDFWVCWFLPAEFEQMYYQDHRSGAFEAGLD